LEQRRSARLVVRPKSAARHGGRERRSRFSSRGCGCRSHPRTGHLGRHGHFCGRRGLRGLAPSSARLSQRSVWLPDRSVTLQLHAFDAGKLRGVVCDRGNLELQCRGRNPQAMRPGQGVGSPQARELRRDADQRRHSPAWNTGSGAETKGSLGTGNVWELNESAFDGTNSLASQADMRGVCFERTPGRIKYFVAGQRTLPPED
jgi:hypothetical protein